jgi:2-C-methyl-D-erythritol 2,4-cyclodiphosphate synthase
MTAERRVGFGYDAHRFAGARTLVLGGVTFQGEPGLEGHSDADVLTHAVIDAVLGGAGLGDIGRHFPDDDARFSGADSIGLLSQAVSIVRDAGWRVVNVDATVICEQPRLAPVVTQIVERLGGALEIEAERVNVKATTNEGMGFIGRGEGIAVCAVALLERASTENERLRSRRGRRRRLT